MSYGKERARYTGISVEGRPIHIGSAPSGAWCVSGEVCLPKVFHVEHFQPPKRRLPQLAAPRQVPSAECVMRRSKSFKWEWHYSRAYFAL
jgi:hypothetical protein